MARRHQVVGSLTVKRIANALLRVYVTMGELGVNDDEGETDRLVTTKDTVRVVLSAYRNDSLALVGG